MKFTIYILLALVSLIASTLAACDCDAADQPCLDKCVTTANGCVVQCQKQNAGDACEQACFAAHW
ncbi:hypothetical protein RMATCC62417_16387 [Rhizopus microsporus]|nr:hypothetical protein RMATCC62417_16387 [Rhizopus microsporus]